MSIRTKHELIVALVEADPEVYDLSQSLPWLNERGRQLCQSHGIELKVEPDGRAMPQNLCESHEATGVACQAEAPDVSEYLEWMPEHLRESHKAARNSGQYPMNGALRLHCCEKCAEFLLELDAGWTQHLGGYLKG